MTSYYNEFDPKKAAWLRELMKQGVIAPGVVDERSIVDVRPDELSGFTQVHLCAGVGIWSYALRLASWPDNRAVWTGSEPCQPHSAAGKMLGGDDERYIRWAVHHHIEHGKPSGVPYYFEQVANGDGLAWLDTLSADMERAQHTVWAFDICSAGLGAPHIRQRLMGVAHTPRNGSGTGLCYSKSAREWWDKFADSSSLIRLADADQRGFGISWDEAGNTNTPGITHPEQHESSSGLADMQCEGLQGHRGHGDGSHKPGRVSSGSYRSVAQEGATRWLANTDGGDASAEGIQCSGEQRQQPQNRRAGGLGNSNDERHERDSGNGWEAQRGIEYPGFDSRPSPTNGFWGNVDWLLCRDGKWRPVEPGTFPLAHGAASRVLRLRGYGDGINAQQAAWFITATEEFVA